MPSIFITTKTKYFTILFILTLSALTTTFKQHAFSSEILNHARIENILEGKIEGDRETSRGIQPGYAYLTIKNKLAQKIIVEYMKVIIDGKERLTKSPRNNGISVNFLTYPEGDIGPNETKIYPLQIDPGRETTLVDHIIIFNLGVAWEDDNLSHKGNFVISKRCNFTIFENAELTNLLGIPSLLLFPGFLMYSLWSILVNIYPNQGDKTELDPKKPIYWFKIITISLPLTLAYPYATEWFGYPRNYIHGYSIYDIALIWSGSLVLTCFIWILHLVTKKLSTSLRMKMSMVNDKDLPLNVLKKLAQRGVKFPLDAVNVDGYIYYKLYEDKKKDEEWLCPPIYVRFKNERDKYKSTFEDKIHRLQGQFGGPKALRNYLLEIIADKKIEDVTEWASDESEPITRPTKRNIPINNTDTPRQVFFILPNKREKKGDP